MAVWRKYLPGSRITPVGQGEWLMIGQRLREIRLRRGLSQGQLAKGISSASYVSMIEKGKVRPSEEIATALAARLAVPPEALLGSVSENEDRTLMEALRALGSKLVKEGNHENSVLQLRQALKMGLRLADEEATAAIYEQMGDVHYRCCRYADAQTQFSAALDIRERQEDKKSAAQLDLKLGHCYFDSGDYRQARVRYQRSLDQTIRESNFKSRVLRNLAMAETKLGEFTESATHYSESAAMARRFEDMEGEAYALLGLGKALQKSGRFKEAIEAARYSEELFERMGQTWGKHASRHNRAVALSGLGRWEEAKNLLEESLTYYRKEGLFKEAAAALEEMARYWIHQRSYESAVAAGHEGMDTTTDQYLQGRLSLVMGQAMLRSGQIDAGLEAVRQAARTFEALDIPYELVRVTDVLIGELRIMGGDGADRVSDTKAR